MTDANYIRHFKVLGKLAKIYDDAGADVSALNTLVATTSGPTALQSLAVSIGGQYLSLNLFYASLTTVPTSTTAVAALVALQAEMAAGVDNKTLSTETTSGLVNFFDAILGSEGTWNTAADASADYKDSVYVVSAVV